MGSDARIFYLMGPSGAGKDSLLAFARERCGGDGPLFPRRYITRPADAGGENHIALSEAEFAQWQRLGLFALHWDSHGYRYGIGRELDAALAAGVDVAINGSRAHLAQARSRYPGRLVPVLIRVSEATLARRLHRRGREPAPQRNARLARAQRFPVEEADVVVIDNDGPLARAGERLLALLAPAPPRQAHK